MILTKAQVEDARTAMKTKCDRRTLTNDLVALIDSHEELRAEAVHYVEAAILLVEGHGDASERTAFLKRARTWRKRSGR
jgi:hypothetical protein